MDLSQKEKIEIDYWKNSSWESPDTFTKENLINKAQELKILDYKIRKFSGLIEGRSKILELGAGQGWAACFMKKYFLPDAHFTVSDISPYALEGLVHWERLFDVKVDRSITCRSYEVPLEDESFDLIYCYAAAHHFVLMEETLSEIKRLLVPGSNAVFMYEPTCSRLFYPLHYKYVNSQRTSVPEDILVPSKIRPMARRLNLEYRNHYDSNQVILRSLLIGVYFNFLRMVKFLNPILPSSSDMVFTKV